MEFIQFLEPWMIPIVIMVCVTLIVAISVIGNIITTSMKKKNSSLSDNQEFLEALRDFKESIDTRVSNLEKIAASENSSAASLHSTEKERKSQRSIELELDGERDSEMTSSEGNSKLRNMLNQ